MQKNYKFKVKSFDVQTGEIKGYANTFNFRDYANDITMPGAFTESLKQHQLDGTVIKMFWQHDSTKPIGVWTEGFEDEKGLYLKGKLILGVQQADEAALLLAAGAIDGLSIGYEVLEEEYSYKEDVNYLIKLNLQEVSVVSSPCNAQSRIESVKSKPTQRELEKQLRKAGLSQKNAKAFLAKGYKAIEDEQEVEVLEPADVMEIVTAIVEAIPEDVLMDVSAEEVQEIFEEAIDEIVDEEKRKARKARKDLADDEYEDTKEATDDEGDTVLDEIMEILEITETDSKNTPRKETLNTDEDNEMLSTPSEDEDFLKSLQSLMRSKAKTGRSNLKAKANAMSAKSKR